MNTDVLDTNVGQKIREPKPNKSKGIPGKKKKLWFYISIMAFPVIQFIIFYLIVNANSLLLAFKEYKVEENGVITESVVWFKNIFDALPIHNDERFIALRSNKREINERKKKYVRLS